MIANQEEIAVNPPFLLQTCRRNTYSIVHDKKQEIMICLIFSCKNKIGDTNAKSSYIWQVFDLLFSFKRISIARLRNFLWLLWLSIVHKQIETNIQTAVFEQLFAEALSGGTLWWINTDSQTSTGTAWGELLLF